MDQIIKIIDSPPKNKIISQKDLLKVNLIKNVKLVNGDRAWRTLYQQSIIQQYQIKQRIKSLEKKQYFAYILEGQIHMYKTCPKNKYPRGLIRAFKKDQYYGFQDFALFLDQSIQIQSQLRTMLLLIPLNIFYQSFRRVIPLNSLQSKGQYLKRLLSCFIDRRRVQRNSILFEQNSIIKNLIIIFEGRGQLIKQQTNISIIFGKNQILGFDELSKDLETFSSTAKCTFQCQILLIPKQKFLKIYEIKHKLSDPILKDYQLIAQQSKQKHILVKFDRPKTQSIQRNIRTATKTKKTNNNNSNPNFFKTQSSFNQISSQIDRKKVTLNSSSFSISQMYMMKFMNRKEKIKNNQIIKYIKSKAPQLILNPYKQYTVIPPLHIRQSTYIRNFKRKLKKSYTQSNQLTSNDDNSF